MHLLTKYPRPKVTEVTLQDSTNYEYFQLKYDGIWAYVELDGSRINVYSRTGNLKASWPFESSFQAVFIGEFMFGSNWASRLGIEGNCYLFDCVEFNGFATDKFGFLRRYEMVREVVLEGSLPQRFKVVMLGETSQFLFSLWKTHVEDGEFEGVVLRNDVPFDEGFAKVKKTVTRDYVVMSVLEGKGKHINSMGALVCGLYNQDGDLVEVCRVGGGFSDADRAALWQASPVGKVVEARGFKVFEKTGALRHPCFVRFRDDKHPYECRL